MPGLDPRPNTNTMQMVVGKSQALWKGQNQRRVQHDCFYGLLMEMSLEQLSQTESGDPKAQRGDGRISLFHKWVGPDLKLQSWLKD